MQVQLPISVIYALVLFGLAVSHLVAAMIFGQIAQKRDKGEGKAGAGWAIGCFGAMAGTVTYGILLTRAIYFIGERILGN